MTNSSVEAFKTSKALRQFLALSVVLLAIFILLRLFESVVLGMGYHFPGGSAVYEFRGMHYDLLIFLKTSGFLLIPFSILYLIGQRAAEIFYITVACLLVLVSLMLQFYFANAMLPLGSDLFAYSWSEIRHTAGSAGGISLITFLPFLIYLALTIVLLRVFKQQKYPRMMLWIFYPAMIGSFFFSSNPNPKDYKTDFQSYLSANKLGYFSSKSFDYFARSGEIENLQKNYEFEGNTADSTEFTYVSKDYPLLHLDETPDVLGNFFNKSNTTPHFVFIIVESLARAYSGENAYLHSFTPFLDSLAQHSLYWENFLSTGGRTFAVLPSTFASLPFAEKGFLEMGDKMPQHLSLIKLLKERGYYTSFTYGGDAHFDLMDVFLKRQGIDKLTDIKSFGAGYKKMPANEENFTWGYGDHEILQMELENARKAPSKPRLDIVLTLSMHSPFNVINQNYYEKMFELYLNARNFTDEEKTADQNYAKQYATILYFDDGLRHFMKEYAKRKDFKNTIFIITGDHRMPEIPLSTQLDRFHVPLVIYSTMLKRTAKFSSISSQFDITPTITAFLRQNYGLQFPLYAHWIGSGLDTVRTFRNIHAYPLMRNKNELTDYLVGTNFMANNDFFRIYPSMDIETENNSTSQAELSQKFMDFKAINNMVCSQNKIVPDSVYQNSNKVAATSNNSRIKTLAALKKKLQTQGNGSFSIVANVFESNSEASEYMNNLKKQGYDARLTNESTKFIVLVGNYKSKKSAAADLTRLKTAGASNAWVVENK